MSTVLERILEWSNELEYWEQTLLARLLENGKLEDQDLRDTLDFFLQDNSLSDTIGERKSIYFNCDKIEKDDKGQKVLLRELFDLENVNALISKQKVTFGDQLTTIFGRNGAGKSGYVRVLGSASFTRGDQTVLPDITKPYSEDLVKKAKLVFEIDKKKQEITLIIGDSCAPLSSFYAFDSTSVIKHMVGRNSFSFSPAGLSLLTDLASATDMIRALVREKIAENEKPCSFENYFSEDSEIKELTCNINANTNFSEIEQVAELKENDERRIHELDELIGKIGLGKYEEELLHIETNYALINRFLKWIDEVNGKINSTKIQSYNDLLTNYNELNTRAQALSITSFANEDLTQIGTKEWVTFVTAANELAKAENTEQNKYPEVGEPCLLCYQPLTETAVTHIRQIWTYLNESIQSELVQIQSNIEISISELQRGIDYPSSEDCKVTVGLVNGVCVDPETNIQSEVLRLVNYCKVLVDGLQNDKLLPLELGFSLSLIEQIKSFLAEIEQTKVELKTVNPQEQYNALYEERKILNHRKTLNTLLPRIKESIENFVWAEKARGCLGSTRKITQKHNTLFDELVKSEYVRIFTEILKFLGRPLIVKIITSGQKGESVKQIQLISDESAEQLANPEKVLSEGEKRAIALADFITEARLDLHSNGLILDDPVTSLDLEWRDKISRLLVEEAQNRQVIIFTHDLPFLYYLSKHAEELKVNKTSHTIYRGDADQKPGYVSLDYCPPLEKSFKSAEPARKMYQKALESDGDNREVFIQSGFGKLRTSYEYLIIFELFNGVVQRFDEQVRVGNLQHVIWNEDILNEIQENFGRISRCIDAHSHTDALQVELSPQLLFQEIEIFENLKRKIVDLKKTH